ncbi:hypothetical protein DPMN_041431 [Dreissena polymorpha]|uniref:Uncharacterized protein n=1 Tax=Dreissena polymorpha TaxID=45954 RepID=A0A9D4CWT2_DREPO|nr:hypothetical protein DPMN_041431 [Dreissena polymorpha]
MHKIEIGAAANPETKMFTKKDESMINYGAKTTNNTNTCKEEEAPPSKQIKSHSKEEEEAPPSKQNKFPGPLAILCDDDEDDADHVDDEEEDEVYEVMNRVESLFRH